jgi:hypothetical protein
MDSFNIDTSGSTGPEDTIECIGFDALTIEKRIFGKLKIMVSITTSCCLEFRQFIVKTGKLNYRSSGKHGAVTFTMHEDDFDDTLQKIHECHDIFSDQEHKEMEDCVKINLMKHAFPAPGYYTLDNKHLKTADITRVYNTYNPNNSSIVFIGMAASGSNYLYSHIGKVSV